MFQVTEWQQDFSADPIFRGFYILKICAVYFFAVVVDIWDLGIIQISSSFQSTATLRLGIRIVN